MADPGLIKGMVADGWGRDAAVEQVDAVIGAIVAHLKAGKFVRLEGIGLLSAPTAAVSAGFPPKHLREQRKIVLRHGALIEKGAPYPDPRVIHPPRPTTGE